MLYGKRDDLEASGASGTYYSVWLNSEDDHGSYADPYEHIENEIIGNIYDDIEEAKDDIRYEFYQTGVFEYYLEENPEVDWVEVYLEVNELDDGIDRGTDDTAYSLMYDRDQNWKEY